MRMEETMNYMYNDKLVMLEIVEMGSFEERMDFIHRMLHLVESMLKEMHEEMDEKIPDCVVISADGDADIMTIDQAEELVEHADYCIEVMEGQLMLRCRSEDVVNIGGTEYLLGMAIVFEMDENGEDCCIYNETAENAVEFLEENSTEIEVDGEIYDALRLI